MDGISITQILLLVALALVVIAGRRFLGPYGRSTEQMLSQLRDELMERRPVYSAETTKHREAEFIRDRLRNRRSGLITLLAILVGGVVLWWLMRA
jgi:Sec-independent protein translocase protein TatA